MNETSENILRCRFVPRGTQVCYYIEPGRWGRGKLAGDYREGSRQFIIKSMTDTGDYVRVARGAVRVIRVKE